MESDHNKELLKKIKQIDIRLRRKVNSLLSGQYRSAFKGQGMVFSDFREYTPGDDVRAISWNLTAKMSRPYIKTFEEERESHILLLVDASASLNFGVGEHSKSEVIELLGSLLAFCSQKNKDLVSLLIFTDDVEIYIPPKKNLKHVFHVIREICNKKRKSKGSDITNASSFLQKILKKQTHIFLFSDFLWAEDFSQELKILSNRHNLVSVVISDPLERELPPLGLVDLEDLETQEIRTIDLGNPFLRSKYNKDMQARREHRKKELLLSRSEIIFVDTQKDIYDPFIKFFQKKGQSFRGNPLNHG